MTAPDFDALPRRVHGSEMPTSAQILAADKRWREMCATASADLAQRIKRLNDRYEAATHEVRE